MPAVAAAYDVFLSYSRADAAAADQLRTRLADAGLKTFLDRYSLPGGKPWQPELETALGHCRALVVLLGPAGIGGWQHREIQLGLVRQGAAEQTPTPFPVIPVLLPNLQPDDVPLGTFLNLNTWVDLRPGLDEPEALQRLIAAAQGRAIDGLTRDLAGLRPYRGLLPFREQDAGLYFGRQRFIDELTAKVRQRSTTNVVAVLGRSGSGKSSIVFAGLFPALRQERGVGAGVWNILDLRSSVAAAETLARGFARAAGPRRWRAGGPVPPRRPCPENGASRSSPGPRRTNPAPPASSFVAMGAVHPGPKREVLTDETRPTPPSRACSSTSLRRGRRTLPWSSAPAPILRRHPDARRAAPPSRTARSASPIRADRRGDRGAGPARSAAASIPS